MKNSPQENNLSFRRTKHNNLPIEKHPYNIEDGNLTLMEELFCHYYMSGDIVGTKGNGTASAKAAGYSEKWAHVAACELLKMPKIRAHMDELRSTMFQEIDITPKKTLQEIAAIAHYNISDYYNADGSIRNPKRLPRHMTAAIKEIEITISKDESGNLKTVVQNLKLHDKKSFLELEGKHQKLFTDVFEWTPGENAAQHDEKARETQKQMLADLRDEQEAEAVIEKAMEEEG